MKNLIRSGIGSMLANKLQWAIVIGWFAWIIVYALTLALNLPTFHLDGAFQTASGLYRLDAGQFPGKDFFPYLGIGPLFALYPAFKILGANLAASFASAHMMTWLVGTLATSLIIHLVWKPTRFVSSVAVGATLYLLPVLLIGHFGLHVPYWAEYAMSPGNSLRPMRAAAPYLIVFGYYFFILRVQSARTRAVLAGGLTGLILLWSNDFAIPSAGLFAMFVCVNALRKREILNMFIYLFTASLAWFALLELATLGHSMPLLAYNFIDVAQNQWWYFGPYSELSRVFNIQQMGKLVSSETYFPIAIFVVLMLITLKHRTIENTLLLWIGAVLFSGAIVASVGGHLDGYFAAAYFWSVITTIALMARFVRNELANRHATLQVLMPGSRTAASTAMALVAGMAALTAIAGYAMQSHQLRESTAQFYVPELGGYLGVEWKEYIELARQSRDAHVFEEYWGLWSATRRIFPDWPVDSVIHAMGDLKTVAEKKLQEADVVISTRNSTSPTWQPWNLSENYWFYTDLMTSWSPQFKSPTTIVWRKGAAARKSEPVQCVIENNKVIRIETTKPGFVEIVVEYKFRGSKRSLLMIRNNLSFVAAANGYVSINPSANLVRFPALITAAGITLLDSKIVGAAGAELRLSLCAARTINFVDDEALYDPATIHEAFFISDENWQHGIARKWAGFMLPNTKAYIQKCKTGRIAKLPNDERRLITGVRSSGKYLYVYLEGAPLDHNKVGSPNLIEIESSMSQLN